ncbi:RNA 2'-phosphotransferase [Paenibacillus auburnensis]|uniref:RNA 2'-phosphotransferase n=1 Tax=Paenibacillus auburnensis TaxID=2905649 RepID=A0ABM9CKH8_9BACL|nr:hypothetical protein [Paenibacillus auburnensis]CAH1215598.1 RNA 2'-phosphotransferase [Paenibacillus auburnensis]
MDRRCKPAKRQLGEETAATHVLLTVDTVKAAASGVTFYYAGNEVWLAELVPADCIAVLAEPEI